MEDCQYMQVPSDNIIDKDSALVIKKFTQGRPFLKQLLVCSGVWTSMFMYGLCVGAPTVFIPQIRREANSSSVISENMASWLTSAYSFSGLAFVLILSLLTKYVGRKITFIIAILDTLAAFIMMYYSRNVNHILVSLIMQGLFCASQIVISITILTEYTSPKYRGIFLIAKSATFYWGVWASNAIGTFFNWKVIPLFGITCAVYTLLTLTFWPESPYWLASKGRFKECAASHRWLKGCDEDTEKELEALINSQKEYLTSYKDANMSVKYRLLDFFRTLKSREFYKPTAISIATGALSVFSGKLVCSVYALDIIKKITNSEATAYNSMLLLDVVTVFSMYTGCILAMFFKRRALLLVVSSLGVLFLFILSLYLYLISLTVIVENKYASILLLAAFSIAVSCGPLIMSVSVYGELIPTRSRNLSVCLIALFAKLINSLSLKTAPYFFKLFGLHGMFLYFGICSLLLIIILYKYLPETKNKTLQEITNSMLGKRSDVCEKF